MSTFTCISCRVAFTDAEVQRSHYKTDWHRYNLKRKVAELPPVTVENFRERVLAQKEQAAEEGKDTSGHCHLCNKHFSTENAFDNHTKSRKHQEAEAKNARKLQHEVEKRNEKNENKGLAVMEENAKVVEKNAKNVALKEVYKNEDKSKQDQPEASGSGSSSASSKVKDKKKVKPGVEEDDEEMGSDAESCESWEGEGLGLEECLFCTQVSECLENNMKHMSVAHSFFIPDTEYLVDLEGLITYLGRKVGEGFMCLWCSEKGRMFYSTEAARKHMVDKGHTKMLFDGDAALEYADFFDYRKSYPDFDPSREGAAGGDEPMEEEEVTLGEISEEDNYQLVLPSGATVGHRTLMRYYRQSLKPTRQRNVSAVTKLMAQYKALGWTGTPGPGAEKRAKDIAYVERLRHKNYMKTGVKANKFQTFFRQQVLY